MRTNIYPADKATHPHRAVSGRRPLHEWFPVRRMLPVLVSLFCGTAIAAPGIPVTASPTGGQVVGGVGSITHDGARTVINQHSGSLAIDWKSFNVGKDAAVLFKQPSVNAAALNRILGQNPSLILGKLSSNGKVFLINPHGIIFGKGAKVNVGGLVASTLDLKSQDFMNGDYKLAAHGDPASVVNHGIIAAASGGSVTLIGGHVANDGLIVANYGHINLDGARKAVLDFGGNGLINVQITGKLEKRLDAQKAAVVNKGTLEAQGGTVVLKAAATQKLFTNLVNNSGVIKAGGISTQGGTVQLVGTGGNTINSGTIDVSGTKGGNVQVLSDQDVTLNAGTDINASGTHGGGVVLIGGDEHGANPQVVNAAHTEVDSGATINADAQQAGNGGKVIVWSDHGTTYRGDISTRGGDVSGNGGFVEVSGKDSLVFQGTADRLAPHGTAGTLLLDPTDLTITDSGTATTTAPCTGGTCESNDATSVLTTTDLAAALFGGPVIVDATAGTGTGSGKIDWTDGSVNASGNSLTLKADSSITFNGTLTNLDDLTFIGTSISGTGSATGAGSIIGFGSSSTPFNLAGTKAGKAGGITFSGFGAADATTVTGANNFDYGTTSSDGMIFAAATDVSGTGAITGLGSTAAFNLTGNTAGNTGTGGISFSGFTSADTTKVTGANNFDYGTTSSDGMIFAAATDVSGTGAITGLGSTAAFNLTGSTAGNTGTGGITFSGFTAADATTVKGAASFDDTSETSDGMTFAGATSVSGTGIISNVTSNFADDSGMSSASGITYSGFGAISGSGDTVTGVTGNFDIGTDKSSASGLDYSGFSLTSVAGSGSGATITGTGQTYNLTGPGQGKVGALSFSGIVNLVDTGTGTFNMHSGADGSLSGSISSASGGTVDYTGYTSAVTYNVSGDSSTGIGVGTTGITTVTGSASNSDTLTGNNATYELTGTNEGTTGNGVNWNSFENIADTGVGTLQAANQTWNLTGANQGTVGLLSGTFSHIGNLVDTGTGTFNMHSGADGSLTGSISSGSGGTVNYADYTSAVTYDVSGDPSTGIGGGTSGITTVTGSAFADTLKGNGATYTLIGSNAGTTGNGVISWTSFENIADVGASGGTLKAANQTWSLTGSNQGKVGLLSGLFSGIANLTDTGTGTFDMHSGADGSLSGSLDAGSNGTLDYTGYSTPVDANLLGTASTGVGGTLSGISTVIADSDLTVQGSAPGSLAIANNRSATTTTLGPLSVTNDLTLAASGNVNQGSGPLTVGRQSSINAGSGDITLNNPDNDFTGMTTLVGGAVNVADKNSLELGPLQAQSLQLTTNGPITQSGILTVTGTSIIGAGSGDITLNNPGNDFGSTVQVSGGTVTLADKNALTLGTLSTKALDVTSTGALNLGSGTVDGVLTATSNNNAITQSGSLTVTGASTIDAGTGPITLADNGNDFQDTVTPTGGDTALADKNALTLGSLQTNNLTATSGGALDLGQGTVGGTLAATAAGDITQAGALQVGGPSTLTVTGSQHDVTLANTGNDFSGQLVTLDASGGGSVGTFSLYDTNAAALFPVLNTVPTNLTVNYPNAHMTAPPLTLAGALDLSAGHGITLDGTVDVESLTLGSNNAPIVQNAGIINVRGNAIAKAGSGIVTLIAGGPSLTLGKLTGSVITLKLSSPGMLTLAGDITASNSLTLESGGGITQSAGSITTHTLSGSAGSGGVQLTSPNNQVDVLGGFSSGGPFRFVNGKTLTLASVGGKPYTVNAGSSPVAIVVRNGSIFQDGTAFMYNGTGLFSAPQGYIGTAGDPIRVRAYGVQTVAGIAHPPAYFFALSVNGGTIPVIGATVVNVPQVAALAGQSLRINGSGSFLDISAVTANYRGYGVVQPGLMLPRGQWDCSADRPYNAFCPEGD